MSSTSHICGPCDKEVATVNVLDQAPVVTDCANWFMLF